MFTIIVSNFTVRGTEICWRIVIVLEVLRLIFCVTNLLSSVCQVRFVHSVLIFVVALVPRIFAEEL